MSKDKSRIKDVWRNDELRDALEWIEEGMVPERFAAEVGYVFEDASVRFSQGGSDGASFVASFADSVAWHFGAFPRAHTFVMAFDDRRHVPERKRATQGDRRRAIEATIARRAVREWSWDNESPIVALNERALPPWERLRLDAGAYARAVSDVVDCVARSVALPPARRLIIDQGHRLVVVESTRAGRTLEPRTLTDVDAVRPRIGEADLMAQWYARAVRTRSLELPPRERAAKRRRRALPSRHFYASPECSEVPIEWQCGAPHDRVESEDDDDEPDASRADAPPDAYNDDEAPSLLMVSTDTDFVVLSLALMADDEHVVTDATTSQIAARRRSNVYVSIGRMHLDSAGRIVTGTHVEARAHREYVDIDRLWRRVSALHGAKSERCRDAAWSFAAFSAACGNDYTLRLSGFSHRSMFAGYRAWLADTSERERRALVKRRRVDGCGDVALLDAAAFARMLVHCYRERLPARLRNAMGNDECGNARWNVVSARVDEQCARQPARRMPDRARLLEYVEQVTWSLAYASTAVHGADHVPP